MPSKKKVAVPKMPFLKTAAEAIGTALGKLAVKTGVAKQTPVTKKASKGPRAGIKKVKAPTKKSAVKAAR